MYVPCEACATGHIYRPVYTDMFLHRTVIETKCEPIVISDMLLVKVKSQWQTTLLE